MSLLLPLSEERVDAARIPSGDPLFAGCPALFIQMTASGRDVAHVAELLAMEGMGAVITIGGQNKTRALQECATAFLRHSVSLARVLVDADQYSGSARLSGAQPLSRSWVQAQLDLGCTFALTDSPYLPAGDVAGVTSTLAQTASMTAGPVIAALPLHLSWLTNAAERDVLLQLINRYQVPVAFMFEHKNDPLGVQAAVAGLVDVLGRAQVKVLLLRSDLAAIGAVAFGASVGALGTKTSLRHIFPVIPKKEGSGFPHAQVAALVSPCMSYRSLPKIAAAALADVDHPERWSCTCRYCRGELLTRITDEATAYQHSMASVAMLAERVLNLPDPATRQTAWVEACRHAQVVNEEVRFDLQLPWTNPPFLAAWHKISGLPSAELAVT